MRCTSLVLVLAAACGDDSNAKKDAAVPRDSTGATADAPPLVACTPRNGTNISLRKLGTVGTNDDSAALLATAPPNDGRLFVVERGGRIRVFENEQLRPEPFLDIRQLSGFATGGEQGLLGLAFHPNYANNRQFFIFYTTGNANVVARYYVSQTDINRAEPAGEVILSIPDFAGNHNGGMIEFGPDNYLYIGTGDGGGGGDPCRVALEVDRTSSTCQNPPQNECTGQYGTQTCEPLLGKMLRIDVNTTSNGKMYGIPADNPYASGGGEPEIFIRGLRNPWRWSFDRMTGDLYIGDVGQNAVEELTILTPAEQNGANLGWSDWEGPNVYRGSPSSAGVKMPQFSRTQGQGWASIIAGQVYRGTCFPDLVGDFFFNDHYANPLLRGRFSGGTFDVTTIPQPQGGWPTSPTSIHADARGELFMTTMAGDVWQIEAAP